MELDGIIGTVEDDFLDLVEFAPLVSEFHRGAEAMLGPDYKKLGRQILIETKAAPKLMKKFEGYFGTDEGAA